MERAELEEEYGRVWTTSELTAEFEVKSFCAPFVSAVHRATGKAGTLQFQHRPRYYFDWRVS